MWIERVYEFRELEKYKTRVHIFHSYYCRRRTIPPPSVISSIISIFTKILRSVYFIHNESRIYLGTLDELITLCVVTVSPDFEELVCRKQNLRDTFTGKITDKSEVITKMV